MAAVSDGGASDLSPLSRRQKGGGRLNTRTAADRRSVAVADNMHNGWFVPLGEPTTDACQRGRADAFEH